MVAFWALSQSVFKNPQKYIFILFLNIFAKNYDEKVQNNCFYFEKYHHI